MRVAHIIKVTRISGAERHLLVLLDGLRRQGIDARLIILVEPRRPMDDMIAEAQARGIPIQRLEIRRHHDLPLLLNIRRALRQMKPDIVHTHLIHADLFGCCGAKLAGIRTVISSRHNDDRFRYHPLWRRISPILWRLTSGGIAVSDSIKDFTVRIEGAPEHHIAVVHYGLEYRWASDDDLHAARQEIRAELKLPPDAMLLGMVCRLVEQKGIPYALEAFQRIGARFPTARLVIAGDGAMVAELRRLGDALGLSSRIHWLGWRRDADRLIASFDIMLMPSLWEGFGLVLLEAMSRRVPVIASRVSAIPEVVSHGETGILIQPRDAAALARAITRLLNDPPLRKHMGLLGAARLEERFSVRQMVAATIAVYQKHIP